MEEELTYEQALAKLEQLTNEMEDGRISVDQLAERLSEAQKLLEYCRARLTSAEKKCNSLLNVEEKE